MSIETKLNAVLSTKTEIKSAIEEKGVEVGNVPFSAYADKISSIVTTGGGGDFSLVNVTQYQPYKPQFSGIMSVSIDGLTYDEGQDMDDITSLNATYSVTSDTMENLNYQDRVYYNSSNHYYLKYHFYNEDIDYMAPDNSDRWCLFYNNTTEYPSFYLGITSNISNGSGINIYSDMIWGKTFNVSAVTSNFPEQPFVLTGKNVQSYNAETELWTFANNVTSFTSDSLENTVSEDYIYPVFSGVILKYPVALGVDWAYITGKLYYQDLNKTLDMNSWQSTETSWNGGKPNEKKLTDVFTMNNAPSLIGKYTDNFAVKMYGKINLNIAGTWKFYARHDDGLALKIDTVSECRSGVESEISEYMTVNVSETGWKDFLMYYHNGGGDKYYQIYVKSPNDSQPVLLNSSMVRAL